MTKIEGYLWLPAATLPAQFSAVWITRDDCVYVAVPHYAVVVLWTLLDWMRYEQSQRGKVVQMVMFDERTAA